MRIFIAVLLLTFLFTGCKIADLRTEVAKNERTSSKGKDILKKMYIAHGADKLALLESYSVIFEDEFYGFKGKNSHPFKENKVTLELSYIPNTFDGNLKILTGKSTNDIWGIQSWQTYTKTVGKELKFSKDRNITFWLPTYQYFIEFPLRIQVATAITYAGEQTIEGVLCQGVLASWNTTEPQKKIDQYLIWTDKKTNRIVKLEYTIREKLKFLTGSVLYKDYVDYNGIILPKTMPVSSSIVKEGELLHQMGVSSFTPNKVSKEELRPNNDIEAIGDSK